MMNEKIYPGLKTKNMRQLCELLEIEYKPKNSELNRKLVGQYCDFHYEGVSIIIDDVFSTPRLINTHSFKHKYNVGDVLFPNYGALLVNSLTYVINQNGSKARAYNVTCLICGYCFDIRETTLNQMGGCSVCSHHKVLKGYNDMWTTNPEMAALLANLEDGYIYAAQSNKKLDWKCPDCGNLIKNKQANEIYVNGLSCKACGDGISYPNKIMHNVLTQLNEDFKPEVKFDWCTFPKYKTNKITYGLYDFVLEQRKLIIEMDGGLNHKDGKAYKNNDVIMEEALYKDKMKDTLAIQNGYKIIRIDAKYINIKDRQERCKIGIIDALSNIFDLSKIDWDEANRFALSSSVVQVCELHNQGLTATQIAEKTKLCVSTVCDYLIQGEKAGLCIYESYIKFNSRFLKSKGYVINNREELEDAKLDYICSYYNNHEDMLMINISDNIKVNRVTLVKYLKKGAELGLCNYDVEESIKQSKIKSGKTRSNIKTKSPDKAFGDFFDLELDETNKSA